jgi:hypothetical protein
MVNIIALSLELYLMVIPVTFYLFLVFIQNLGADRQALNIGLTLNQLDQQTRRRSAKTNADLELLQLRYFIIVH